MLVVIWIYFLFLVLFFLGDLGIVGLYRVLYGWDILLSVWLLFILFLLVYDFLSYIFLWLRVGVFFILFFFVIFNLVFFFKVRLLVWILIKFVRRIIKRFNFIFVICRLSLFKGLNVDLRFSFR